MKAAILRAFGHPLIIEDVPSVTPEDGEVVLQTMACGIDGTDLKLLDGFGYTPELPFIMGHEIAGVVSAVGRGVADFKPGDRVAVYNFLICGQCVYCLTHREQLCLNMRGVMGVLQRPGGYAEYVRVPAQQLIRLPDSVAWEDAATACDAALTAYHALQRSRLRLGETVVIIGVGGVGSVLVQLARRAGARVIAVDRAAQRADWALENGAHQFVDSGTTPDIPQAVKDVTGGLGADCVVDVVGTEATMRAGFNSAQRGGRMIVVGYTPEHLPLPGKQLAQNELEVIGTRAGRRQDLIDALHLMATGQLKSIVRHRYPLEQVNEALKHLRSGTAIGRIVLTYST
ncbi:MAG: zinc-binding dehydrogenase [Anaerolineae bacterium]|nr:zinc-binding dehydrogenase [Anaerolineae bacterium]